MLSSKGTGNSIPWGILTLEAVLIVLSVLLALALENWRENREHQHLAERALQTVIDEAMDNCERIQSLLPYHRAVIAGEEEYEGLGKVFIRNDAWSSAQNAGAAQHLMYEVAAAVGTVHALQRDHRKLVEAGIQAVYNAGTSQDPQQEKFRRMLSEGQNDWLPGPHPLMLPDLIRTQANLVNAYDTLFEVSEEHYGDAIEANGSCMRASPGRKLP